MAEEWVSITEAAARLTASGDAVDRSTLSRYLKQHAEALPLRRDGKANLVEIGAVTAHRAENVRLRRPEFGGSATGGQGGDLSDAGPDDAGGRRGKDEGRAGGIGGQRRGPATAPRRFSGSQSDGVARKAQADAEMRELDLAERRGELTPTDEVDRAGREAIVVMQAAFDRAVETEASLLSVRYGWDERVARLALKSFARKGLDMFNTMIRERIDAAGRRETAGDTIVESGTEAPAALQ